MAPSLLERPFFDNYVLKKKEAAKRARHKIINIWSRRSTVLPQFVGLTFGVYNGKKFVPVQVNEQMVGHKFGEFAPTRTFNAHGGNTSGSGAAVSSGSSSGGSSDNKATRK